MVKGYRHLSVLSTNSAASMLLLATLPVVIWLGLKLTRRLSQQADHQETSTMSADTTSSLFPDRPIRPLPKRRLRERLSPQVADSIQYPPAPQALTPLFSYPYTLRDEKEDPGFGSRSRGSELDPRQSRRTGLTTEEEEEDPTTVRGQTGRDASRSSARLGQHQWQKREWESPAVGILRFFLLLVFSKASYPSKEDAEESGCIEWCPCHK